MADLVSDSGEFSCDYCASKLKLTVLNSSSSGDSKKIANKSNCFLPPPAGMCTFPGIPPGTPCVGAPPGTVVDTGQTTVKIDGQPALGDGAKFMCPLGQSVSLSKAGQTVGKHDEASAGLELTSLIADFIPFVGSVKSAIELIAAKDPITGASVSRSSAVTGMALGAVPGGKVVRTVFQKKWAKLATKLGGKTIKDPSKRAQFIRSLNKKVSSKGPSSKNRPKQKSQDFKSRKISALSKKKRQNYQKKFDDRTLTKEEYHKLDSDTRFKKRREKGIDEFWDKEPEKIAKGKPSRKWTPQQEKDILNGKRPKDANGKTIEGHHKYSAQEYPQHANDPNNIEPLTREEHLRWHGGNTKNPTHGYPLQP